MSPAEPPGAVGDDVTRTARPPRSLVENLLDDQDRRWQAGERRHVEAYLHDHPAVRDEPDAVLDLIFHEVLLRRTRGESPALAEYEARFAWLGERLKNFPALQEALSPEGDVHEAATQTARQPPEPVPSPSGLPAESDPEQVLPPARPSPSMPPTRAAVPEAPPTVAPGQGAVPAVPPDRWSIPGYEILGELGRGGMGVVYRSRQVALDRLVALKMVFPGGRSAEEDRVRFENEARAVARLRHPNIVSVYEVGEWQGRPYFAMELVEGPTLSRRLRQAPPTPAEAAGLLETLARAVHYAHTQGVVHRDLKPANILLQSVARSPEPVADAAGDGLRAKDYGLPKVTDFGLAKRLDAGPGQTVTGAILGTPGYMAPEQAAGKTREIGPAADVYGLGAVLYRVLTGRPPFRTASMLETLEQVRSREPIPPATLQPELPRDLDTICLKCLQKEPGRRYASALELAEDLRRFRVGEPIRARPVGAWERGLKWARRRPLAAGLAAVSVFALVSAAAGGVAFALYAREHTRRIEAAAEQARVEQSRLHYRRLFTLGQGALGRSAWPEAAEQFRAAAAVAGEASLDDLSAEAEERLRATEEAADADRRGRRARKRYALFRKEVRDALGPGATLGAGVSLFGRGADAPALKAALAVYGLDRPGQKELVPDQELSEAQRAEVREGCYVLLLTCADALVREGGPAKAAEALARLDQAEAVGPPTRAYHLRRADCLEKAGRPREVREAARRAEALRPTAPVDFFLCGERLFRRRELGPAAAEFRRALQKRPGDFWALYYLAVCQLGLGEARQALDPLGTCVEQQPGAAWLYLLRGVAYGRLREYRAAEADFRQALDLGTGAEERYALYVNRGLLRTEQNRLAEALEDFAEASRIDPGRPEAWAHASSAYQRQGRLDLAAARLEEAIRAAVRRPDAGVAAADLYHRRARLHEQRHEWDAALADYERAAAGHAGPQAAPARARDLAAKGELLHRRGQDARALEAYDAALKAWPDDADASLWRARSLIVREQYQEATAALDVYLEKNPARSAWVYQVRGVARARSGNPLGAVEDFTRALDLQPASVATRCLRGWEFARSGSAALALQDFESVLKAEPRNVRARVGRGYARATLGDADAAARDAEQALELDPKGARTLRDAARVFAVVVGKTDAAPRGSGEGSEARFAYQARAVDLLIRGAEATPAGGRRFAYWTEVESDPDFAPVRRAPAYSRVRAVFALSPEEALRPHR